MVLFDSFIYVVIGNNYATNWDGKYPSETLDFALNNEEVNDMIDREKIAIGGGHSQGGMETFNAITQYENGVMYDAAFSISPADKELAISLNYSELNTDKVMFRKSNVGHGEMLYQSNAYVIAWLDYYLKDISENRDAFFGYSPEINTNAHYQDFYSSEE